MEGTSAGEVYRGDPLIRGDPVAPLDVFSPAAASQAIAIGVPALGRDYVPQVAEAPLPHASAALRSPGWDTSPEAMVDPIGKCQPIVCFVYHEDTAPPEKDLPRYRQPPVSPGLKDYNALYCGEESKQGRPVWTSSSP